MIALILIAHPNQAIRLKYKTMHEMAGDYVFEAESGVEALFLTRVIKFDRILVDRFINEIGFQGVYDELEGQGYGELVEEIQ